MVNTDLLVEIAAMHYESGLTQQEISRRIGVSRSYVSRLLTRALEEGIVEISVHRPVTVDTTLQQELVHRFDLLDARVLTALADSAHTDELMGQLGASYLNAIVQNEMTIGVSFGNSVYQLVRAMPHRSDLSGVKVVQLVGGRHALSSETDGPLVAETLARTLNAPFYRLHAPALLDTQESRDTLMSLPTIADVLAMTRAADVAVVGIGAWSNFAPSLRRSGYRLDAQELHDLEQAGVVGDILTRCIDQSGVIIPSPTNRRVVGIDPSDLQHMRWSIGVAWREEKAQAVLAALRGRYLNVLITDQDCARRVLDASA
jgi:DNA-binding transcriptional regulator LsrR (DeoR family)